MCSIWLKQEYRDYCQSMQLIFIICAAGVSYVKKFEYNLILVLSVLNRAHHSTLWPERASVPDVKALSWDKSEIKPLEQLGHHHFSLHLKTHHHPLFSISGFIHVVVLVIV